MLIRKTGILIVALAVFFSMAEISAAGDVRQELTEKSTLEKIMRRGVLRVGMSTFVPWAMNNKNGKLIGFEIDVARRLAEDMGVDIQFVPTKWSGIIPALLTGKFDVIIGGMGIRPDRNLKVNFTIPYEHSGMSLVASRKKAGNFNSIADFNKEEVTLAARMGTTAADAAEKHMPRAKLKLFDDEAQAIQELLNKRVHGVVASAPMPAFQAARHPEKLFVPIEDTFTKEPIGFAIRKGDIDTLNYFNNWIRLRQADGWLKERHDYWFKTRKWEDQIQ